MSLRLCMLFIVNKHLYAFYIYMRNLSRAKDHLASSECESMLLQSFYENLPGKLFRLTLVLSATCYEAYFLMR